MPPKAPMNDQRADSTLDQINETPALDPLAAIAQEEIDANEAVRARIEADEQAAADAVMNELVAGWQEACRHGADIITSMYDGLKPVWSADRMDNLGAALARADAHYGWGGAGQLLGHPLVGVGVAALPVAIGTVQFVKLEKLKLEAAKQARLDGMRAAGTLPAAMTPPAAPGGQAQQGTNGRTPPPAENRQKVPNIAGAMDGAIAHDTMAA